MLTVKYCDPDALEDAKSGSKRTGTDWIVVRSDHGDEIYTWHAYEFCRYRPELMLPKIPRGILAMVKAG